MDSFLIIITGSLVSISCSILGTYLIFRRMAMVGDAISHAVLPGIVISFLILGESQPFWTLFGAASMGLFATLCIEYFHQKVKIQTDASIGLTFTWLFAVGVILISYFASNAHIDQDCLLYGEIAYVPLDTIQIFGVYVPKAIVVISVVLLIILFFVIFTYKELFITTFDPQFANVIGISSTIWHYILMSLTSLTTVASFESVGAILVVALLIVPPATAYLLATNLVTMLWLSCFFGVLASILGYYFAYFINGSIAGAMATVAGFQFFVVFIYTAFLRKKLKKNVVDEEISNLKFIK